MPPSLRAIIPSAARSVRCWRWRKHAPGPFGFLQPQRRAPVVDPDLIFIPLIAIDAHGTRLGRGKGHYDRALGHLKKTGAKLIGVGWSMQRLETIIPIDPWDIPLHGFASPEGVEEFA